MAVESSVDSYINAQPEEVMSYSDYWRQNNSYGFRGKDANPDNLGVKFLDLFTGNGKAVKSDYEAYLANVNNRNEFMAQQSARGYDKMMDDSKYQRMMKDFEKAGLNPYLIVNNGGISASSSPSGAKASYNGYQKNKNSDNGNTGRNLALLLLAVAKIAASAL